MRPLTILPDIEELLPPLSQEEFEGLKADMIANGCRDPLVIWNETIIDGHNRYSIALEHDIPFKTVEMTFESINDAKIWIWKNQGNRRNLTPISKIELAAKMKPILEARAKERMSLGGLSTYSNQHTKGSSQGVVILPHPADSKRVRDELAEQAGVSGRTFDKGVYVLENADEETKDRLRRGEKGLSISGVYNDLKTQENGDERPAPPNHCVHLKNISTDDPAPLIRVLFDLFSEEFRLKFIEKVIDKIVCEIGKQKAEELLIHLAKKSI